MKRTFPWLLALALCLCACSRHPQKLLVPSLPLRQSADYLIEASGRQFAIHFDIKAYNDIELVFLQPKELSGLKLCYNNYKLSISYNSITIERDLTEFTNKAVILNLIYFFEDALYSQKISAAKSDGEWIFKSGPECRLDFEFRFNETTHLIESFSLLNSSISGRLIH